MNKEEFLSAFHSDKSGTVKKVIAKDLDRIEALAASDDKDKGESSVFDLAREEDRIRKEMRGDGLSPENIKKYADRFSSANLGTKEAQKLNWLDELTGLRNRRALFGEAVRFLNLEKRENNHCSILMIDIDHFKDVNDEHGHAAGDQVLQKVAEILRQAVRKSDFVYRYGGEEFTIVLVHTDVSDAAKIAEKVRAEIEKTSVVVTDENENIQKLNRTISVGCVGTDQLSSWHDADDAGEDMSRNGKMKTLLEEMIRKADKALYEAKNGGRNRVAVHAETNNGNIL